MKLLRAKDRKKEHLSPEEKAKLEAVRKRDRDRRLSQKQAMADKVAAEKRAWDAKTNKEIFEEDWRKELALERAAHTRALNAVKRDYNKLATYSKFTELIFDAYTALPEVKEQLATYDFAEKTKQWMPRNTATMIREYQEDREKVKQLREKYNSNK